MKLFRTVRAGTITMIGVLYAHVASAQVQAAASSFRTFVLKVGNAVSKTIFPILVAMAVLAFFGNLVIFIWKMDNEKEREQFKKYTVNALVALTVLLAVWGVVGIFTTTFFNASPAIPQLPTSE